MKRFGLIGYPLTHSFSWDYFRQKFDREGIRDCIYQNFPLPTIEKYPGLLRELPDLHGLNVTIPYKQSVISWLESLDSDALQIGAVNCIYFRDGKGEGYNTDHLAFLESISPLLTPTHRKALILGTGGSSRAVAYALRKLGLEFLFVSRRKQHQRVVTYDDLRKDMLREFQVLINTTPVGMFPDLNSFPDIPYDQLTDHHILFDLIYNPNLTQFLERGAARGAQVKNGREMLEKQADFSWRIWNP